MSGINVGAVFYPKEFQKFLFTDALGIGRFIKIGNPAPEIMAPFVGIVEIVCGTLVNMGFSHSRNQFLIYNISVAKYFSTKIPIPSWTRLFIFYLPSLAICFGNASAGTNRFFNVFGSIFLIIVEVENCLSTTNS